MSDYSKDPRTWDTSDLVLAIAEIAARRSYVAVSSHEPIGRRVSEWEREEAEVRESAQAERDTAVMAALNARVRTPRLPVQDDPDLDTILHFLPSEVENMKMQAQVAALTWVIENSVTTHGIENEINRIRNGGCLRS